MAIRYAVAFTLIGLSLAMSAMALAEYSRWSLVLLLPSATFVLLGIVYAVARPALLGKRANGRCSWLGVAWSWPYAIMNEFAWRLVTSRGPAIGQLNENLFFGRRLLCGEKGQSELPQLHGCLDLTAEFTEAPFLRMLPNYRCLPILDGTAPTTDQLRDAVEWLTQATQQGPVYVHCALGHGRTGTILIAYLVSTGQEPDVDSALLTLQKVRSSLNINSVQRRRLADFLETVRRGEE